MLVDDLFESRSNFGVGDPVIITGNVEYQGKTGDVREVGRDGAFVVVDLYNYGSHSFHASDVSYNNYADSDDEAEYQQGVAEGSEQQWTVTVGTKTGGTSHTMTFAGTKEQAIKKAVARFGTSKNPVVKAVPAKQSVAEEEKVGNMPADKFDDAMARLKKLAGSGPLKTVWDPQKRVYRNVPTAVQPKK